MSGDFTDSDVPAYDWNSDDEPPADKPMDVSVVAFQGNGVLKRILHPGQSFDKPGLGDRVQVRWKRLLLPDEILRCLEYACLGHAPDILDDWIAKTFVSAQRTEDDLGYTDRLPFAVEETLRTMRVSECSIAVCDAASDYAKCITTSSSLRDTNTNYATVVKERKNKAQRILRHMKMLFNDGNATDCNLAEEKCVYIIKLLRFKKQSAITTDRSVIKETISSVPPYFPSPREGDLVRYSWCPAMEEDSCETQSCYFGVLKREGLPPTPAAYSVLLEMRRGESCRVSLTATSSEDAESPKITQAWNITLTEVLRSECISIANIRCPCAPPLSVFRYQQVVACQYGLKQQLSVEDGCRVAAIVAFRDASSVTSAVSPFRPTDALSLEGVGPGITTWTVGTGVVPSWLDTLVKSLQTGSRIVLRVPGTDALFEDPLYHQAFWRSFTRDYPQWHDPQVSNGEKLMASENQLLAWTDVRLCNAPGLKEAVERWSNLDPFFTLSKNGAEYADTPAENHPLRHLNIVESLEVNIKGNWKSGVGSIQHMATLRDWLQEHSCLSFWDDNVLASLPKRTQPAPAEILIDIQLIDVLGRVAMPWTFTEQERLTWGRSWKEFGNYLFKRKCFALAVAYYTRAIEIVRFSAPVDALRVSLPSAASQQYSESQEALGENENQHRATRELYEALLSNITQCYISAKCWKEATVAALSCVKRKNCSLECAAKGFYRAALAYFQMGMYTECRKYLKECREHDPCNKPASVRPQRRHINS